MRSSNTSPHRNTILSSIYSKSWPNTATPPKNGVVAQPNSSTSNKTDPYNPPNHRPISLSNCILKLWASILTSIGTQIAEAEGVFTDTADRFRSHRNIYDSLSTQIMMYEDAKNIRKTYTHHTHTSKMPLEGWIAEFSSNS